MGGKAQVQVSEKWKWEYFNRHGCGRHASVRYTWSSPFLSPGSIALLILQPRLVRFASWWWQQSLRSPAISNELKIRRWQEGALKHGRAALAAMQNCKGPRVYDPLKHEVNKQWTLDVRLLDVLPILHTSVHRDCKKNSSRISSSLHRSWK
jgi:hypothetical protein